MIASSKVVPVPLGAIIARDLIGSRPDKPQSPSHTAPRARHVTAGSLKLHPQKVIVSGDVVGVLMRVTASRPDGRLMDTLLAQTRRLADDGRWCEYWAVADDQDILDAFWAGQDPHA